MKQQPWAFMLATVRMWLHQWKRFAALAVISLLGVAVLTGVYAGCRDMLQGAQRLYNAQQYYDIQIVSAHGLTQHQVDQVRGVAGVNRVQVEHVMRGELSVNDIKRMTNVQELGADGLNQPYLQQGELPRRNGEVAVTQAYLNDSGKRVGDSIEVQFEAMPQAPQSLHSPQSAQSSQSSQVSQQQQLQALQSTQALVQQHASQQALSPALLARQEAAKAVAQAAAKAAEQTAQPQHYVITGVVVDPNDLNNPTRALYRINMHDFMLFVPMGSLPVSQVMDAAATHDMPFAHVVSVQVADAQKLDTFQKPYEDLVKATADRIKDVAKNDASVAKESANTAKSDAAPAAATPSSTSDTSAQVSPWRVNTRLTAESFASLKADISAIESLGKAFPVVFLLVAVLVALTTMTRTVVEDRSFIGMYAALGYGKLAIVLRYVVFALVACLVGAGLGNLIGFLAIPSFLLEILQRLYVVPQVELLYDWNYGTWGVLLFALSAMAVTAIAAGNALRSMPAELMRPKAPKAGTRILLERITPLWSRMKFLNKVTARNLFRFKGRLLMTISGVAGCTALILCALALNDTVATLSQHQYHDIYHYDLMAVSQPGEFSAMRDQLHRDGRVTQSLEVQVDRGSIDNAQGASARVQFIALEDWQPLQEMITLRDSATQKPLKPSSEQSLHQGLIIARSAANNLGITEGMDIDVQDGAGQTARAHVAALTDNLIGANVYMASSYYHKLFGEGARGDSALGDFAPNAIMARLNGNPDSQIEYASQLSRKSSVLSAVSSVDVERSFTMDLMSAVVMIIIVLAGSLALVVLFTLVNTNLSERVREVATLKVLGFYDREVHRYMSREMLILTLLGILIGLPLGRGVAALLTQALSMPSIYFAVEVNWWSYCIAGFATLAFSLAVIWLTYPVLDRVDPISSLKSVE